MTRTTAISRLRRLLTEETFFAPSVLPAPLVAELARLRGRKAQSAVVDSFCAAAKRYDDGHRPYDDSTMDVMLDDVFPAYGSTAILRLLGRFKKVAYLGEDGMHALFAPALARLDSARDGEKLVAFFHAFVSSEIDRVDPDLDRVAASLRSVRRHLARETLRAIERELKAARAVQGQERRLDATLEATSPRQLERMIASDGVALCHGHRCTSSFEQAMLRHVSRLRLAVLEAFVARVLEKPETYVVTGSVPYLFLRDPAAGARAALRLAGRGRESRLALIDGLECLLDWARDARGSDGATGRIGKRGPVRAAMTRALAELRRLETRASAVEGKAEALRLAAAPAARLAKIAANDGHLLAREHPASPAFHAAIARQLDRLPVRCFTAMADRCLDRDGNRALEPALAYMFLADQVEARRHVLERGFGPGNGRGWLNNALMELEREYVPDDARSRPWRTLLHERPGAARAIRLTRRALQPAFLDPLDRIQA